MLCKFLAYVLHAMHVLTPRSQTGHILTQGAPTCNCHPDNVLQRFHIFIIFSCFPQLGWGKILRWELISSRYTPLMFSHSGVWMPAFKEREKYPVMTNSEIVDCFYGSSIGRKQVNSILCENYTPHAPNIMRTKMWISGINPYFTKTGFYSSHKACSSWCDKVKMVYL